MTARGKREERVVFYVQTQKGREGANAQRNISWTRGREYNVCVWRVLH